MEGSVCVGGGGGRGDCQERDGVRGRARRLYAAGLGNPLCVALSGATQHSSLAIERLLKVGQRHPRQSPHPLPVQPVRSGPPSGGGVGGGGVGGGATGGGRSASCIDGEDAGLAVPSNQAKAPRDEP